MLAGGSTASSVNDIANLNTFSKVKGTPGASRKMSSLPARKGRKEIKKLDRKGNKNKTFYQQVGLD